MAERKPATKGTKKPAPRTSAKASKGFTAEERAAMRERAKELKAVTSKADAEREVLAKIAEMPKPDRVTAKRIHAIVKDKAPALSPRLWYGMPAYAREDGKVVCFFQSAEKFKTRYATLGFSERANLDNGAMWPTAFALTTVDRRRRGADRRAREESGALRTERLAVIPLASLLPQEMGGVSAN